MNTIVPFSGLEKLKLFFKCQRNFLEIICLKIPKFKEKYKGEKKIQRLMETCTRTETSIFDLFV